MKKMILTLIAVVATVLQTSAMSYEQARREALFLTDKMAYELNLSDAQYEAAYEINLDYLMGVTGRHDVFGTYWERRNADLNYVLYSWQWDLFCAATYFFRPLYWEAGYWHFGVYGRYPHRDYFYFGRPHFYATYRGGHSWHRNGGHSFYQHHHDVYRPHTHRDNHIGMRDGWNRGDYRSHGPGHSSTHITGRSSTGTHNHGMNRQDNTGRSTNGGRDGNHGNQGSGNHGNANQGSGNHGNANQGSGNHGNSNHGNANQGNSNQGSGNHGSGNTNAGSGRQTSPRTVNYQSARYSGGVSSTAGRSVNATSSARSVVGTSGLRGSSFSSNRGTSASSSASRSASYGRSTGSSYSRGNSFSSSTRSTVAGSHASGASRSSVSSHSGGGSRSSVGSHSGGGRSGGRR